MVITGGSMGIGLAVAQACAALGAHCTLMARHAGALDRAVAMLPGGCACHTGCVLDVGDRAAVERMARGVADTQGTIHGLVNCAGTYGTIGRIDRTDPEQFEAAVRTNFLGTYFMCHYLVPLLRGAQRGKIVNFSGGGATSPLPNYSAYAASKAAIVRLTENTACELCEEGIDVNAVAPGFVATRIHDMTLASRERAGGQFYDTTERLMQAGGDPPTQVTRLTTFLLSSASDGISGKLISAVWDPWDTEAYQEQLRGRHLATLRRIDGRQFREVSA